jgi:Tfp pilus assembly protein PilW
MRTLKTFLLTLTLAAAAGCAGASRPSAPLADTSPGTSTAAQSAPAQGGGEASRGQLDMKTVSLERTEDPAAPQQQGPNAAPVERKIIRNATLTLEVEQPGKALQRIASLAESRGGFVVTSDSRQQTGDNGERAYEVITVELRVPAAQFDAALADIRAAGGSVTAQKITGKDVTEEYIDLEARLRTQRALESQLLEIMKRAQAVADAVSVQRELTNVRTEIERVEGRRRFLENQSSLSTISVTLQPPAPLIGTTGFFRSVGSAFGEGVDIAAAITLFFIRLLLALIPVIIFIGLPAYFLLRYLVRRVRSRPAPPAPQYQPQPQPQEFQQPPAV